MINKTKVHQGFVITIQLLFVSLWMYAALSKLLEFQDFQTQLGQSPLLSPFADVVAIGIPSIELLTVVLLLMGRTKLLGYYISFVLMSLFTAYIIVVLNFNDFVPCSCGGVLEDLSWTAHLIFNILFVLLAAIAIFYHSTKKPSNSFFITIRLLSWLIASSVLVVGLFLFTSTTIKNNNPFIRHFPHHPIKEIATVELGVNSYYFAGSDQSHIYLGNSTAPLHLLKIHLQTKDTTHCRINLIENKYPYKSVSVQVKDSSFYLFDGTVPIIYKGSTRDWIAHRWLYKNIYFADAKVIDTQRLAIKAIRNSSRATSFGILNTTSWKIDWQGKVIEKQKDGIFCSDGEILWDSVNTGYIYFYRNGYQVLEESMDLYQNTSIDTVSTVQLSLSKPNKNGEVQLNKPPLQIHQKSRLFKDRIFIHSKRIGRFEEKRMHRQASVIDEYHWRDKQYLRSFYIYHKKSKKLKDFWVIDNLCIALLDELLVFYQFKEKLREKEKRLPMNLQDNDLP